MEKRILTLVVELDQPSHPAWIWNSHLLNESVEGLRVLSITEGDECKELQEKIEELEEYIREI